MRLLIVDDEPRNLDILEAHLRPLGHSMVRATSGRDALRVIDDGDVDAVLLDMMMPDLTGIDVLIHIRARPDGLRLPVLLVTALNDRAARLRGLQAGADEFLEKPVDPAVLRARVHTLLRLKEASDELARRNQQLEQLQALQTQLTNFIVHDLKNPIGVAQANIQYVLSRVARSHDEDLGDALRDAEDGVRRVFALVEDLLSVAKADEGRLPVHKKPVAVQAIIDEVRRRQARSAEERGVALEVAVDGEREILADPPLLRRALENLVDNALRHTPRSGRVQLAAKVGEDVTFTVSNTGRAVPPAERERIFEKYARATARERVGPGLGLYFCRRAAEAHGGSIRVVESPEWPASFVLSLPT